MSHPNPAALVRKFAVLGCFLATAAEAQGLPPAAGSPAPPAPAWTLTAGRESFWLRDVASAGPPVDASPIAWQGEGPAMTAAYDRGRPWRLHHFESWFASTGGFSLNSPVRSIPGPSADRVFRGGGRYEYRRYPFRNLWGSGIDVGAGVDGGAEYLLFSRHFEPAIELRTGITNLGTAGVVAIRLRRWRRVDAQAAWANGVSIGRQTSTHRAETETTFRGWGGGWQTHLHVRGSVLIKPRMSLVAAYLRSGEGRFATHDLLTFGRSRVTLGVAYER